MKEQDLEQLKRISHEIKFKTCISVSKEFFGIRKTKVFLNRAEQFDYCDLVEVDIGEDFFVCNFEFNYIEYFMVVEHRIKRNGNKKVRKYFLGIGRLNSFIFGSSSMCISFNYLTKESLMKAINELKTREIIES